LASNQSRALRVRCLVNALLEEKVRGAYLQIGVHPNSVCETFSKVRQFDDSILQGTWLTEDEVGHVSSIPTRLKNLSTSDFDILEQHGFETAQINHRIFASNLKENA